MIDLMALLRPQKLLFLLAILLLIPIGVVAVLRRTTITPRATQSTVSAIKISPGQIIASPGGDSIHLSAQAVDAVGENVDRVRYQWGMSSTNAIGTVLQEIGNDKLATFTPSANSGRGDLWVKGFDINGNMVTGSIVVIVGLPTPSCTPLPEEVTNCMNQGKTLDDCTATMGAPQFPWCRPSPTPASQTRCWNEVYDNNGTHMWRNGCRGVPSPGFFCTQSLVNLTAEEEIQYQAWVLNGKPPIPGCVSPPPSCTPLPDYCQKSNWQECVATMGVPAGGWCPWPTPLVGDLDHNNVINIYDYNLMVQNFGQANCGNVADIDGNCVVNIYDYNLLVQNYGRSR